MNRKYRKELKKLQEKPKCRITGIYIIPCKAYNGFWGKNGYKSFDFIFEKCNEKIGWCHWEGDVIDLENTKLMGMHIDCENCNDYIRLFTSFEFEISDMIISNLTISVKEVEIL